MHIAYITNGLPYPGNNGVPMAGWALIKHMLKVGYKVTVIGLCFEGDSFCNKKNESMILALGADVAVIPYSRNRSAYQRNIFKKIAGIFKSDLDSLYPSAKTREELGSLLQRVNPEAIVAVHNEPLAAMWGLKTPPCLGIMGDPSLFPVYHNWRYMFSSDLLEFFKKSIPVIRQISKLYRWDIKLLKQCAKRGSFAAHYASWFRRHGVDDCKYYRVPVIDEPGGHGQKNRQTEKSKTKPTMVLLGGLQVTATRAGLRFFFEDVIPALNMLLGGENYEVRIIGGGGLPRELQKYLKHPSVKILGYVDNIADELMGADVFLVPTPIRLGIRVRIITAFSYGLCIVAHCANAAGVPELINGNNCLLSESGPEMARQIMRALTDKLLRQTLMENARKTYEDYFSEDAAGKHIVSEIESMAITNRYRFY